ncbi:unnamed protein product [Arctogadus glacialis]
MSDCLTCGIAPIHSLAAGHVASHPCIKHERARVQPNVQSARLKPRHSFAHSSSHHVNLLERAKTCYITLIQKSFIIFLIQPGVQNRVFSAATIIMSEPQKRTGYLTQKDGKQVTVIKNWLLERKKLKAKSAQTCNQYEATIYEWDMHVAFSFYICGKHCSLKVGKGLELVEHAEEKLPNILGNEYRFRWEDEEGTQWRRLEHQKDNVVKLLCYDERGNIFLMDKSKNRPGISCLYKIVEASK